VYFLDQTSDLSTLVDRALRHRENRTAMNCFRRDHDWRERFITASPFSSLLNPFAGQRAA
jgi:hypothetical protein